jgi:DNA mismatch repair protein MutL
MRTIFSLPQDVIAKIAAGEVIERPSYAVKELIENAIDAKADVIQINVEEAGLKRITVIDNGNGMTEEDLEICFLPHTTSKLREEHQLESIRTLGFRGEALSSIAAISQMTIQSRTREAAGGVAIRLRGHKVEEIVPIGTPVGTIVTVDDLFQSVPARKKFLKSPQTEFRHITDIVINFALAYPYIHFVLTHNKKPILDLPQKQNLLERLKVLLGLSLFEQLIPVAFAEGYLEITGFVGKPQVAGKANQKQFLFVNNRLVTDRIISLAVKEAFGSLLPATSTPVFLLHLTLPAEVVDINIHPRKENVAFLTSSEVFASVKQAVMQTLEEHNLTFRLAKFKHDTSARLGETTSFSGALLKEVVLPWDRTAPGELATDAPAIQLHQTYLLAPTRDGLLLVDQHAAHERILYEQFVKAFDKEKKHKQSRELNKPQTIQFSLTEAQILEEHASLFADLGFVIEPFQGTSFNVRAVPTVFTGRNIEKILKDMIADLSQESGIKTIDTSTQRMLKFLACRAAVKAGDPLTQTQIKQILKNLEATPNNTNCPHGRPTQIAVTLGELQRMFKRS